MTTEEDLPARIRETQEMVEELRRRRREQPPVDRLGFGPEDAAEFKRKRREREQLLTGWNPK